MGYNTRFTASVGGPKATYDRFVADASEQEAWYGEYGPALHFWLDSDNYDRMKWYDWSKDMASLSLKYPNLLFSLEGEGEDSGDIWKAWARNGKVVEARAKIIFEPAGDLDELLPLDPEAEAREAAEASKAANARLEKAKRDAEEAFQAARRAATKAQNDLEAISKLQELAVPTGGIDPRSDEDIADAARGY